MGPWTRRATYQSLNMASSTCHILGAIFGDWYVGPMGPWVLGAPGICKYYTACVRYSRADSLGILSLREVKNNPRASPNGYFHELGIHSGGYA